jgi:hypothetical protein
MTLTIVATPDTTFAVPPPRITIDLTTTGGASDAFTVMRNDPDGKQRPVVLEANSRFTSSAWTGWDYHAPFNQPVSYTVFSAGQQATSSPDVTLVETQSWLQHPTNPALSIPVDKVMSIGERTSVSTATTHWAYGAHYPVVRSEGVRRARTGTLTFQTQSADSLKVFHELLADSGVILLNLVLPGQPDEIWSWVLPGDQKDTNPAGDGWVWYPNRTVSFSYQRVDTPAANTAPLWIYGTVIVDPAMPTYADLLTVYATYGDLVVDYRQLT